MIRNGKDIANGAVVSTQVCIVGSGPAGITAAWYLQKAGLKVTLIEGSRDFRGQDLEESWPDKVKLYDGVADGLFSTNEPKFLILPNYQQTQPSERERIYGGTSAHWGGQSRPLDPIVFEERPGFPGWPVTRAELEPFYLKAAGFCSLYEDFSTEYWARVLNPSDPPAAIPHVEGFDAEMYQFIGGDLDFSTRIFEGQTTIGDSAADVILNASLLEIDHAQGTVRSLRVASMNDQSQKDTEFTIEADVFVLACGAVGNAHQLLLSDAGNEHKQVGRYFMCHPLSKDGIIGVSGRYLTDPQKRLMAGDKLAGSRDAGTWLDGNGVHVEGRFSPTADVQREKGIGSCWFWAGGGQSYFEMAPNDKSYVTLADSYDKVFNQKQAKITWDLGDLDRRTYEETAKLFQASVGKLHGTVSFWSWDETKKWNEWVVNGHHMGTTRMSSDPAKGVVDKNLKVHSLDNLYVAGASVFASGGVSNPTFTIITLSIRLAEHLIDTMGA